MDTIRAGRRNGVEEGDTDDRRDDQRPSQPPVGQFVPAHVPQNELQRREAEAVIESTHGRIIRAGAGRVVSAWVYLGRQPVG